MLLLEVKGYEGEEDRAKYEAARRRARAVSSWGQMSRWVFEPCKGPHQTREFRRSTEDEARDSRGSGKMKLARDSHNRTCWTPGTGIGLDHALDFLLLTLDCIDWATLVTKVDQPVVG